jgi:tetratricopeptide (TPR) repeat protein
VYDLFFSYARQDTERVVAILGALRDEGLQVWFDQTDVADFASVTRSIREGLGQSKALIAYYSLTYPQRHACQWELTAAFVAAQQDGDVRRRVLVINPEASAEHVYPVELRDARFAAAPTPTDFPALRLLARKVAEHLQALAGPLADIRPLDKPRWFPKEGTRYRHFVGRTTELWRVHSSLHARDAPIIGKAGPDSTQIIGLGGVGKSLLAEEYALRFGAAYPGGVFWLRAHGNDETGTTMSPTERETVREDQLREFAHNLGLPIEGRVPSEIEGDLAAEIERRGLACLWVVDDVPSGLDPESLRRWFAPHPLARMLLTTRSHEYANLAEPLQLGVLSASEGFELLVSRRAPDTPQEEDAARGIVQDLGGHALALDVAAAALKRSTGSLNFQEFRAKLAEPAEDVLEFAADLASHLPNGHQKDIAGTLIHSLRLLGDEGWDLLRLASVLAVAPISPTFVGIVFTLADELEPDAAQRRALIAARDAEDLSLADMLEGGLRAVHALVSRAVRFRDASPQRARALRAAAVKIIVIVLSATSRDPSLHQGVELEVVHARELTKSGDDDADQRLLGHLAEYEHAKGDYRAAVQQLRQHVDYHRQAKGPDDRDTLSWSSALVATLQQAGDVTGAHVLAEEVAEDTAHALGPEDPTTLEAMNNRAIALAARGNLVGSLQLHEEVLSTRRRVLGPEHRDTLTSMSNVAEVLRRLGDLPRSRKLNEEALDALRRTYGRDHPETLTTLNNLGLVLRAQGELDAARTLQEESVAVHRRTLGPEHPATLNTLVNLASVLGHQGKVKEARKLEEEALAVSRRVLTREHPQTSVAAWNLLQTLRRLRDREASRAVLENDLLWLLERDPATLDEQQQQIRQWLTQMDIDKVTSRRLPWWKRLFVHS